MNKSSLVLSLLGGIYIYKMYNVGGAVAGSVQTPAYREKKMEKWSGPIGMPLSIWFSFVFPSYVCESHLRN